MKAHIYIYTKEEGGRMTAIFNNYRPSIWFEGDIVAHDAFLHTEEIMLKGGNSYFVELSFLYPDLVKEKLKAKYFTMREGQKIVAKGELL